MEYLLQYEYTITYVKEEDNTVVDALSRMPKETPPSLDTHISAIFMIGNDPPLFTNIRKGDKHDMWCTSIMKDLKHDMIDRKLNITLKNGLLFMGGHLIIPKYKNLREDLYWLAHNNLGHFGGEKSYLTLHSKFYWPNMWRDLLSAYILVCADCQQNKSMTSKVPGPLHPLPVPDTRFNSVGIDFVGPLPLDEGNNVIITMTDCLGADTQIAACSTDITAEEFANIFFDTWYCKNGCPCKIILD